MTHSTWPALAAALTLSIASASPAIGQTHRPSSVATQPLVDAGAFRDKPAYDRKKAMTIPPAMVRMIVPGMSKDAVYRIVGAPQFGEIITRRFDYILNLAATGEEPLRCRMQVVFGKPEHQPITSDHTAVSKVLWQTQACADRVAVG